MSGCQPQTVVFQGWRFNHGSGFERPSFSLVVTTVGMRGGGWSLWRSRATTEAAEARIGVNLPAPEIAQTAITHICPDRGEIAEQRRSQLWGECTTGKGTSITTCITCEIEDSDKRATFSFLIVLLSSYFMLAFENSFLPRPVWSFSSHDSLWMSAPVMLLKPNQVFFKNNKKRGRQRVNKLSSLH